MKGEKIKIIKLEDLPPENQLRTLRVWDLAATKGDGDYTAGIKISRQINKEWAFAPDVARLLVESALDTTKQQQIYPVNVGQNSGYSILEVAQTAARLLGYNVEFTFDASKPDGAPRKVLADTTFREQRPDFVFTPLAEGIQETIDYYRLQL